MPRFDQSGPNGQGSVNRRQRGLCQQAEYAFFNAFDGGQGQGRGKCRQMRQRVEPGTSPGRIQRRMGIAGNERSGSGDNLESLKEQYESAMKMIESLQDEVAVLKAQQK